MSEIEKKTETSEVEPDELSNIPEEKQNQYIAIDCEMAGSYRYSKIITIYIILSATSRFLFVRHFLTEPAKLFLMNIVNQRRPYTI